MSLIPGYDEPFLDGSIVNGVVVETKPYTETMTVGMKIVVGRGPCGCGAASLDHPRVLVTTVRALGMGLIITAVAPYRVSDGREMGISGDDHFRQILNPNESLDAQYALCEDELNDMIMLRDSVGSGYPAHEYLQLECLRLEAKLDDLMDLVTDRL